MSELMMFMNRQDEVRRREAAEAEVIRRQDAKDAQQASREFLQTMLTLGAPIIGQIFGRREEPKSIDQAIMEHLRSTTENQNKMIERLQDRVEKTASTGSDSMSAFEMMENMQDRTFARIKQMEDMAKEKADEMLALRGEGSSDDGKPKSVFESMMTTMLPAIAKGIVGLSDVQQQAVAEASAPVPARKQLPAAPLKRVVLSPAATQPQAQPAQPVRIPKNPVNFMGLPSASKPAPLAAVVLPPETPKPLTTVSPEKPTLMKTLKDRVTEILVPSIGQALQARTPAAHAAQTGLTLLERAGIRPDLALKEFTWDTIQKAADGYGIPALMRPTVNDWLKAYHSELTQRIGQVAASG
jgi:gas vesicle protein